MMTRSEARREADGYAKSAEEQADRGMSTETTRNQALVWATLSLTFATMALDMERQP